MERLALGNEKCPGFGFIDILLLKVLVLHRALVDLLPQRLDLLRLNLILSLLLMNNLLLLDRQILDLLLLSSGSRHAAGNLSSQVLEFHSSRL